MALTTAPFTLALGNNCRGWELGVVKKDHNIYNNPWKKIIYASNKEKRRKDGENVDRAK